MASGKNASRAGEKADRPRRIDAHVHGRPFGQLKFRGSASRYVDARRAEGIDAVALLGPREMVVKAAERFGDFVIPVAMYRLRNFPNVDLRRDIELAIDQGCRAIKFIGPLAPYSDQRYWPLYQVCDERKVLAIFHTGYLGFHGEPEIPPVEISHMRAAHVDAVARRFPAMKILMSHFSNPWWEEAWKVSWSNANVYADLSGHTAIFRSMNMWAETFAPNGKLMADSLAKLVFASDESYLHNGDHKFAAWVEFYQTLLDRVNAPAGLRKKVWSETAARLFGVKLA